jgi:TnpA family transposase
VVAVDGSQVDTCENNLLAESHIRYGGYGGIAIRHVADSYTALFSHFIPCGVWEAVYIIEGCYATSPTSSPTPARRTQGQSLPVFGLAALLGFELLPRIRNWHDLIFYRPDARTRYQHIDALFGDNAIDWDLIEKHWTSTPPRWTSPTRPTPWPPRGTRATTTIWPPSLRTPPTPTAASAT